jgi:2-desacetyl-2-hydroxyethyl bacteriochlorophyllide A dehydrogenase
MKAAVIEGAKSIKITDVVTPVAGNGQVLVRIHAVGICGSDIHGFKGIIPKRRPVGLIMGHEAAGEVVEVGKEQKGWTKGERVAIDPQISCGDCFACRRGWTNLCENMAAIGSAMRGFKHGAMCEYLVVPGRQLNKMPNGLSYAEGAMFEPVAHALHLFNRTCVNVGDTVVIVGTGTIGLVAVQVARLMGASRIIAVDILHERLKLARKLGADITIDSSKTDPVQEVLEHTQGRGADIAVEAVGHSATYEYCIRCVRKRGTVLALGFADEKVYFPSQKLLFSEVSIVGFTGFSHEGELVLNLIEAHKIEVKSLITHTFALEDAQLAFETACDPSANAIKVMIIPG